MVKSWCKVVQIFNKLFVWVECQYQWKISIGYYYIIYVGKMHSLPDHSSLVKIKQALTQVGKFLKLPTPDSTQISQRNTNTLLTVCHSVGSCTSCLCKWEDTADESSPTLDCTVPHFFNLTKLYWLPHLLSWLFKLMYSIPRQLIPVCILGHIT